MGPIPAEDSEVSEHFYIYPGGYLLIRRSGDVPLDGVAFSIELLEWGRTFSYFLGRDSSSFLRLPNVSEYLYCR